MNIRSLFLSALLITGAFSAIPVSANSQIVNWAGNSLIPTIKSAGTAFGADVKNFAKTTLQAIDSFIDKHPKDAKGIGLLATIAVLIGSGMASSSHYDAVYPYVNELKNLLYYVERQRFLCGPLSSYLSCNLYSEDFKNACVIFNAASYDSKENHPQAYQLAKETLQKVTQNEIKRLEKTMVPGIIAATGLGTIATIVAYKTGLLSKMANRILAAKQSFGF